MTINITKSTTKELLDFYNSHVDQFGWDSVKRFSDRVSAERRVKALLDNLGATTDEPKKKVRRNAKTVESKPTRETIAATKTKAPNKTLSEAIAESWKDPVVAAARKAHHNVLVDGVTYRSVLDAFNQLSLPISKHVRFRKMLKSEGAANFDGHHFSLVEKDGQ